MKWQTADVWDVSQQLLLVYTFSLFQQVHRLRQLLSMHADEVYSLESRKAQLKLSLDERRHEIEVHRDGLKAELKLVREDIHR
jgi:hypothetical protein